MELGILVADKPEIIIAEKTLNLVRTGLLDFDYAVVGSYSRMVLEGENAEDPFNENSDLDIAIEKQQARIAAEVLKNHPGFKHFIEINDYGQKGTFSEYLVNGGRLTPVHIVGSFTPQQKENSTIIDGIRYLATEPGMY